MLAFRTTLARHRDRLMQEKGDEGFTLIELLIVVLIIGVLAAIAVPIFLTATQGAAENTAKSNVQSAVTAIGVYITTEGELPGADSWDTEVAFPNAPEGSDGHVTYVPVGTAGFCVQATGNNVTYFATDSAGVAEGECPE